MGHGIALPTDLPSLVRTKANNIFGTDFGAGHSTNY